MIRDYVIVRDFNNPTDMALWLNDLPGTLVSREGFIDTEVTGIKSVAHSFYPPGVIVDSVLAILCTVVVSLETPDYED